MRCEDVKSKPEPPKTPNDPRPTRGWVKIDEGSCKDLDFMKSLYVGTTPL